jgi:hypothetical protein
MIIIDYLDICYATLLILLYKLVIIPILYAILGFYFVIFLVDEFFFQFYLGILF